LFGGKFAAAVGGVGMAGGLFGEAIGAEGGHGTDRADEDEVLDAGSEGSFC
jgi:hypothetical protein